MSNKSLAAYRRSKKEKKERSVKVTILLSIPYDNDGHDHIDAYLSSTPQFGIRDIKDKLLYFNISHINTMT